MADTLRIDTHVHLWDPGLGYDWLGAGADILRHPYGLRELSMAAADAGVERVVLVEANRGDATENADNLRLAETSALVGAVIGSGPGTDPQLGYGATLGSAPHGSKLRGFRDSSTEAPVPASGVAALESSLVFETVSPWRDPDGFARLASAPRHLLILDHLGGPPTGGGERARWLETMLRLSRSPNVVCKVSGLLTNPAFTRSDNPDADLLTVLRAFGEDRVVAGSDWPICLQGGGYAESLRASLALCQRAFPAMPARRLDDNAARFYSIPPPTVDPESLRSRNEEDPLTTVSAG